jgi:peroxiredoxin
MSLAIGTPAPAFALRSQHFEKISLEDLAGTRSMIVFMPYAFTGTCQGELCEIRDNHDRFNASDIRVVAITCNTTNSNAVWAYQEGFQFDILSDFWPHGKVASAYDSFDETYGYAKRTTYILDEENVIADVVASDTLGVPREFTEYETALKLG